MQNKEFDYQLLVRFIDGKTNEEETAQVLAWINSAGENKALYFQVKDILDHQRAAGITPAGMEARWQQVQEAWQQPAAGRRRVNRGWLKYAAVFILLAGGAAYYLYRSSRPQWVTVRAAQQDRPFALWLPDSSRVWLGPGGELRYAKNMTKHGRAVWLKGAGYFEVAARTAGFTVHTRRMNITVLGTSFMVKDDDRRSSVVVNTGAVKAAAQQQALVLRAGESVLLENNRLRRHKVNAALYAAWKDGDFQFNNTSLQEIAEMINIIYGYDVEIEKPALLKDETIGGRVSIGNEDQLWKVLSAQLNVTITKENGKVIIQPR